MPTNRRFRAIAFWLFTAACVIGAVGYVRWRVQHVDAGSAPPLLDPADPRAAADIDHTRGVPHVVFLSSSVDAPGHVALAKLDALGLQQILSGPDCERSYAGKDWGLCLTINRESMQPRGFAFILDRRFQTVATLPLAGLPIRARVSPDQRYAVATVFVTGESYSGDFTTRTTLIDLSTKREIADLEQFTVERDGRPFKAVDFNFWGVTFFQDGNRFFATLGTAGKRLLVEGDIARRHLRVVAMDIECPSLSPDERHLVFKRQTKVGSGWQLWARELSTGREWAITEDGQDVDDQVEWLDNTHVIYGRIYGPGAPDTSLSLWISDVTPESGLDQQLFIRSASSPSVIR
jgi:hypothetical protein